MKVNIIYNVEPSGNCPVQAEGEVNGVPFYFRARGENLTFYINYPSNDFVYSEKYMGETYQHWLSKGVKAPTMCAGWANKDECKEFIEKAANAYMSDWNEKNLDIVANGGEEV